MSQFHTVRDGFLMRPVIRIDEKCSCGWSRTTVGKAGCDWYFKYDNGGLCPECGLSVSKDFEEDKHGLLAVVEEWGNE